MNGRKRVVQRLWGLVMCEGGLSLSAGERVLSTLREGVDCAPGDVWARPTRSM